MSLHLSLQTLPIHIVHTILEYLEGYPRGHVGPTTERYFDRKAVLAPLLLVGEHWCTAALAAICETCELRFIRRRNAIKVTFPAWPDGAPYLEYYKTPFVRRVIVSANLWDDLCDGAFSWTISMSQYENLVFPSATTLLLYFSRPANSHLVNTHRSWYEPATNDWRVTEAAQSLLRLVPDVAHVSVQVCSISDKEPHFVQFYNRMIVELCQGNVSSLNLHSWFNGFLLPLRLDGITGLTRLTQGFNIPCSTFMRLAFLNAGTLGALDVALSWELAGLFYRMTFILSQASARF